MTDFTPDSTRYVKPDVTAATVEADHARLKTIMANLAASADEHVAVEELEAWRRRFLRALRQFQSRLLMHFDLEEDGGFFNGVLRVAPQNYHRIRALEAEHPKIIRELDHLIGFVKNPMRGPERVLPEIRFRLHRLIEMIRVHEAAECALIQDAYYQDYGVGD